MTWPWIVLISVVGAVALLAVIQLLLRGLARSGAAKADEALAGKSIILREPSANFFGVRSKGMGQVRGNGVLTLTDKRLHFLLWTPEREISIDLLSIRSTETPRSFLGRTKLAPLLQVNFTNERGEDDAAAWLVADLRAWTVALRGGAET